VAERSFEERVRGVAALDHPATQAVYRLLVERDELTRDDTAAALDLARSVAAFHLDKLVEAGLAAVHFERRSGRVGPGAGRPSKVYRRADAEIGVSLPERRYDLAGSVLAAGVERANVEQAVRREAFDTGRRLGAAAAASLSARAGRARRRDALVAVLEEHGYEPRVVDGEIALANCPFHALATEHRDLVCGMNVDLISGIAAGLETDDLTPRLEPASGWCCVRIAVG
jgi:predicted ArsR family transcriptional regulator